VNAETYKRFSPYELTTVRVTPVTGVPRSSERNGETDLTEVSAALAGTVSQQDAAPASLLKKSLAAASEFQRRAVAEYLKQEEKEPIGSEAMRNMIWVKSVVSEGWACSECAWKFNPSGPPRGASLDEMKQNFSRQRDSEFASHVCARHSRTKGQPPEARSAIDGLRMSGTTADLE
jgi:hypothetical protein